MRNFYNLVFGRRFAGLADFLLHKIRVVIKHIPIYIHTHMYHLGMKTSGWTNIFPLCYDTVSKTFVLWNPEVESIKLNYFNNSPLPALGDYVWEDTNADGIQDANESGIANALVRLFNCTTHLEVANTTTNATGYYLFDNLTPGNYSVEFVLPSGYVFSPQDQGGDDTLNSDANETGMTNCTTLSAGETDLTWDAGMYQLAVDAYIRIEPPNATNEYNATHTILASVRINNGSGWGVPPVGTQINFSIKNVTGSASFEDGIDNCSTGADGNCAINITPSVPGLVRVHGRTNVTVDGFELFRETDGLGNNSWDANKTWIVYCISGYKFWDKTANGTSPDDAPLANWTINVTNTTTGKLVGSDVTNVNFTNTLPMCELTINKTCLIPSPPGPFVCSDAKPIDELTMIWDGTQSIRIKAWKKARWEAVSS